MGCTSSMQIDDTAGTETGSKTMFPLSMYQKSLIQETWDTVEKDLLIFGTGIFHKLFKAKPELLSVFPEFGYLESIDEILQLPRLTGHPKKITQAIREAIKSLDDAENFMTKLEALGQKHVENSLRPDYLHALGDAFVQQVQEILRDDCTKDVQKAWRDFYNFICKLMKQGLAKKQIGKGKGNVGWF
ncbi:neuroglobin-like [Rhopilema esculentum]|uniref:neuroglobin-like n=1 Tax=Rhopilema esculentum TaxID=499914 RepID=UPI0031D9189C